MRCNVHYALLHHLESGFDAQSWEGIMPVEGENPETILKDVLALLRITHPAPYMVVGLRHKEETS